MFFKYCFVWFVSLEYKEKNPLLGHEIFTPPVHMADAPQNIAFIAEIGNKSVAFAAKTDKISVFLLLCLHHKQGGHPLAGQGSVKSATWRRDAALWL